MKTRLLITAATEKELSAVSTDAYADIVDADFLVTGVGSVFTVYALMNYLVNNKNPDYIINIGIAGSFTLRYAIGDTIVVTEDFFADLGVEEQTGFKSIWEEGLIGSGEFPFNKGAVQCDPRIKELLGPDIKKVRGITVNTASGIDKTIRRYIERYMPDIETMEVAAALYVGRMENIPVIALRSVSNIIEPRNKEAWDINKAIEALQPALNNIIEKIH